MSALSSSVASQGVNASLPKVSMLPFNADPPPPRRPLTSFDHLLPPARRARETPHRPLNRLQITLQNIPNVSPSPFNAFLLPFRALIPFCDTYPSPF